MLLKTEIKVPGNTRFVFIESLSPVNGLGKILFDRNKIWFTSPVPYTTIEKFFIVSGCAKEKVPILA